MSGPRTTDGGWQSRHRAQHTCVLPPGGMLAFFCTMMRRTMIDEIGPQDEAFVPYAGFGGDDHYCWLAEQRGWRLAFVGDLVIPHKRRTTMRAVYGEERIKEMQDKALETFKGMAK
jgi:GT2 family glycosyltransferase